MSLTSYIASKIDLGYFCTFNQFLALSFGIKTYTFVYRSQCGLRQSQVTDEMMTYWPALGRSYQFQWDVMCRVCVFGYVCIFLRLKSFVSHLFLSKQNSRWPFILYSNKIPGYILFKFEEYHFCKF